MDIHAGVDKCFCMSKEQSLNGATQWRILSSAVIHPLKQNTNSSLGLGGLTDP